MFKTLCFSVLLSSCFCVAGCDDKKASAQPVVTTTAATAVTSAALAGVPVFKPGNKNHELLLSVYAVMNYYTFTSNRDKINKVEIVPNADPSTGIIIKIFHGTPEIVHFMKLTNSDVWTIVNKRTYIPPPATPTSTVAPSNTTSTPNP